MENEPFLSVSTTLTYIHKYEFDSSATASASASASAESTFFLLTSIFYLLGTASETEGPQDSPCETRVNYTDCVALNNQNRFKALRLFRAPKKLVAMWPRWRNLMVNVEVESEVF